MASPILRCRDLGKCYPLRQNRAKRGYRTLREDLLRLPARMWAATVAGERKTGDFWALRDVSFDVAPGEVLGVIGRNGAGKSTLLKILSRITAPTTGSVDLYGRVGSLLEVGTGFHPELSGRENIFLSGAMLGMRRHEVRSRFDEIVAFAEVEKFIDTPCKHYSSGMYTRLGFAVAAHLDTAILLVDEVLAVGDANFQQRCLGKMAAVAKGGRTVLFVSHNLGAVGSLCPRAILLDEGGLKQDGPSREVIEGYLARVAQASGAEIEGLSAAGPAWVRAARVCDEAGLVRRVFSMTEPIRVECDVTLSRPGSYTLSLQVKEFDFNPIVHCTSGDAGFTLPEGPGDFRFAITVPPLQLYPGRYWVRLALTETVSGVQHEVDRLGVQIEQDFSLCARPLPRQAGLLYRTASWVQLPASPASASVPVAAPVSSSPLT